MALDARDVTNLSHTLSKVYSKLMADAADDRDANRSMTFLQRLLAAQHVADTSSLIQELSRLTDWTQRAPEPIGNKPAQSRSPNPQGNFRKALTNARAPESAATDTPPVKS